MRSERRPMTCPFCGKEFTSRVILQVDCARPEDREADLANGSLFTYLCPACGKEVYFNHYLLWVDEGHTVAVCNITCEEEKKAVDEALAALVAFGKAAKIRRRYVFSPQHLFEKSVIFSMGLDDRAVEIVKQIVTARVISDYPQKSISDVLFFPMEGEFGFVFQCADGDLTVNLPKDVFYAAVKRFSFSEPSPEKVDAAWAVAYLTENKPC